MRLLPRRQRNQPTMPPADDSPAKPPPATEPPDTRCTEVTRKGTRCKLPAVPGSDRCLIHPASPKTPAAV